MENIFEYEDNGGELTIKHLKSGVKDTLTSIVIPETIGGKPVSCISDYAFTGSSITDIEIGENIKVIGKAAFLSSPKLKKVIWNCNCDKIPEYCFANCSELKQFDFLRIKEIKTGAFHNSGLEKIYLPWNIESISDSAFGECKELKSVFWNCSCGKIPESCFCGCSKIFQFDFSKVKEIGNFAFSQSGLQEVYLPENIENISDRVFLHCKQLKKIVWNCKYNQIPESCFCGCSSLLQFDFSNVKILGKGSFKESGLQEISLPKNIKYIFKSAFKDCKELKNVTWDCECYKIPELCFHNCYSLSQFDFSNVKIVGSDAFGGSGLQKIHLTPNIKEIEWRTFTYCTKLNEVIWDCDYKEVPELCFYGCSSLKQFDFSNLRKLKKEAFASSGLTSVELNKGTEVCKRCFANCENLKKVEWLSSRRIKGDIFKGCKNITEIFVSDKVKVIDETAFMASPNAEITFV